MLPSALGRQQLQAGFPPLREHQFSLSGVDHGQRPRKRSTCFACRTRNGGKDNPEKQHRGSRRSVISYATLGLGGQNTGAYFSHTTEKSSGATTILETVGA